MQWTTVVIFAAVVILYLFVRRSDQVAANDAQALLAGGALVVDVRTHAEFNAGHLPGAINLPVDHIGSTLPPQVPDKSQTILVYCQSGFRSRVAKRTVTALGYTQVFNLGSYQRAVRIMKRG
jgi:phage shock protein E